MVFLIGDCVALGLSTGECPIGCIEAMNADFIKLSLLSAFDGGVFKSVAVRLRDVVRVEFATELTREEARESGEFLFRGDENEKTRYFDTKHLAAFQTEWREEHSTRKPQVTP